MMLEFFNFIKCHTTIILNWLPIYKISLFCFLVFPIYPITILKNQNPQTRTILFLFLLLGIWIMQVLFWNNLMLS